MNVPRVLFTHTLLKHLSFRDTFTQVNNCLIQSLPLFPTKNRTDCKSYFMIPYLRDYRRVGSVQYQNPF